MPIKFLRASAVWDRRGKSRSSTYNDIRAGLFPPPIPLGPRTSGWLEEEVEAVNAAVLAGKDEAELRRLVKELVSQREAKFAARVHAEAALDTALASMAQRAPMRKARLSASLRQSVSEGNPPRTGRSK